MASIRMSVFLCLISVQVAFAGIVAKSGSWQMLSYGMDVNLTQTTTPSAEDFSLIWYYENDNGGTWKAFSKDAELVSLINAVGSYGDKIKMGQAFWVKAKKDFSIIPYVSEVDILPSSQGWHLISTSLALPASFLSSRPIGSQLFVYRNNTWSYAYNNGQNVVSSTGTPYLATNGSEGFWLYNPVDVNNSYPRYNEAYHEFKDTFSNKQFSWGNTSLKLDQNGTVISNETLYNGGKWNGYEFSDWNIRFRVTKGDKRYVFVFNRAYSPSTYQPLDYYTLSSISVSRFQTLSNGVVETLDSNVTNYYEQNIAVALTDYNRSKIVHSTVQNALSTLETLIQNPTSYAQTTFNTVKSSLSTLSNNDDAKVVLALMTLVEILDEDIVKNNFVVFNGNASKTLSLATFFTDFLPSDTQSWVELAQNVSNYSTNAKNLMQTLASRLKLKADTLVTIGDNTDFYLPYNGKSINYADVKALRGMMLALAFKLQYISSYALGSDEWLSTSTENNIEFQKASYDPVGFLNSKTFFTAPNTSSLVIAKAYLREFLGLYYALLNAEYHEREGMMVSGANLEARNLKRHLKLAMNNLDGISSQMTYANDWAEWSWDSQTYQSNVEHKKEFMTFDVRSLFDSSTAITINDLPVFSYNGTLHVNNSMIINEPVDVQWNPLAVQSSGTFSATNNINAFFKSFVNSEGQKFTGINLLNEIFTH